MSLSFFFSTELACPPRGRTDGEGNVLKRKATEQELRDPNEKMKRYEEDGYNVQKWAH